MMGKMKDVVNQVEEFYDAGLSVEEIATRMNMSVPVIQDIFKWLSITEVIEVDISRLD